MALVYSTETGRTCPGCRQALAACSCKAGAVKVGDGNVKVARSNKGRGGKTVTLVSGLPLEPMALAVLGKELRTACGSGGTVKDGVIEVQGDHCERVMQALVKAGYQPKRTGA